MIRRCVRGIVNYYEVLGVDIDANDLEIKKAYYGLVKKYHPDASGQEMTENFRLISEAYSTLMNIEKKIDHDMKLAAETGTKVVNDTDFNPNESEYSKFWEKTNDRQYFNAYEAKRKEYLRDYREQLLEKNTPLVDKMREDNRRNVLFGFFICCVIFKIAYSRLTANRGNKEEIELNQMIIREIEEIKKERSLRRNFKVYENN